MSALVDCFICHQTGYYTWRIILGHILDLHQLADKNECRVCNSCIHILKLLYKSEKAAEQKKAPVQVPLYYEQAPQKKSLQSGQRSVLIMFRFILVTLCLPWMCIHIIPPLSWTCTWISPLNWANPSIKALKMFRFILVTLCLPWMCIHIIPPLSWTSTGTISPLL